MGIYIKDMEMPEDCSKCVVKYFTPCYEEKHLCPLTELPPHGRLIDANELGLTDFEIIMCNGDYKKGLEMLAKRFENAPTIIPADKDDET